MTKLTEFHVRFLLPALVFFGSVLLPTLAISNTFVIDISTREKLVKAAMERTNYDVRYDGRYVQIEYPGGDVSADTGVCTDVIIRSYRAAGIDLQVLVHDDMKANFGEYPASWGLSRPDPSIDHRRVPNLQVFFGRHGVSLPVSDDPEGYMPGDIVTWLLPGNLPHIGIVVGRRSQDMARHLIVHNIGEGPKMEDILFKYQITGHYRFDGIE